MNIEAFRPFAEANTWGALLPEIFLAGLAVALLLVDTLVSRKDHELIVKVGIWGQILLLGVMVLGYTGGFPSATQELFSGLITQSAVTEIMRIFLLCASILVGVYGAVFLDRQNLPRTEFYAISIIVTAAMMLLVQSTHFLMVFVALETVAIGFYVLIAYSRRSGASLEAGLKYLILSGLSSGMLLFGIVLLYGVAGTPGLAGTAADPLEFSMLGIFIALNPEEPLVLAGTILVLAGVCFKIGAVPFQVWVPDVYQGAPTPVTAFLAVASKAMGFIVLINLVKGPFAGLQELLVPLFSTLAVLTILVGNLGALTQRNVKRLMGLSGVAHAGYLLIGVVACLTVDWAVYAVLFYLVTYFLASFAVFGVMSQLSCVQDEDQELDHYTDLGKRSPALAFVLVVGIGSLAGIPPLAGFIGKLLLFLAAFEAGLFLLIGVAVIGVVISIYYYFGWLREAVFRNWRNPEDRLTGIESPLPKPAGPVVALLIGLSVLTVCLGFFPSIVDILLSL